MSRNTYLAYKRGMTKIIKILEDQGFFAEGSIQNLTTEIIIESIDRLESTSRSNASLSITLATLTSFRIWLISNRFIAYDSNFDKVYREQLSSVQRNVSVPTNHALHYQIIPENFQASASIKIIERTRNLALLQLLISTDCKPHEISKMTVKDIDLISQTAAIYPTPSTIRTISFSDEAAHALSEYWTERNWHNLNDPAFARHDRGAGKHHQGLTTRSIQNIVNQMGELGKGVNNLTPSDLRMNYFISILAQPLDFSSTTRSSASETSNDDRIH